MPLLAPYPVFALKLNSMKPARRRSDIRLATVHVEIGERLSMDDGPRRTRPNDDKDSRAGFVRVREHDLKNVSVDIPQDGLVVCTEVCGSGKSSLAFGTLYAEAQRR